MQLASERRGRTVACAALLALVAGCTDAPTSPQAFQLLAGGKDWIAIAAPTDLPTAATWAPFLLQQGDSGHALVERVRALEHQADRARLDGEFARAGDLRREASSLAVNSLTAVPPASVVLESAWALDRWLRRVDAVGVSEPHVVAAIDSVRAGRDAADGSLESGDTIAAVKQLMAASEQIRRWSPAEIAWRALQRAEVGVAAMPESGTAYNRARHLAQSAREELRSGDPLRALERALYAIQLAGGAQLSSAPADEPGDCGERGC
jgi:hypothetical protein